MEGKLQNLETWMSQISDSVEVVLVYDESSDGTITELNRIVGKNQRREQITILSGKFGSPGLARNAGFTSANGDWICFWDSDDLGFPLSVLEVLQRRANEKLGEIYCFGYHLMKTNGQSVEWAGWTNSQDSNLSLIALNPGLWRFCFPRQIAGSTEFSSLRMAEDQLFLAQVGLNKVPIRFEDTVAYQYFRNVEGQLTSSQGALKDLDLSIRLLLKEQRINPDQRDFINKLLVRQCLTSIKIKDWKLGISAMVTLFQLALRTPKDFTAWILFIVRNKSNA